VVVFQCFISATGVRSGSIGTNYSFPYVFLSFFLCFFPFPTVARGKVSETKRMGTKNQII